MASLPAGLPLTPALSLKGTGGKTKEASRGCHPELVEGWLPQKQRGPEWAVTEMDAPT